MNKLKESKLMVRFPTGLWVYVTEILEETNDFRVSIYDTNAVSGTQIEYARSVDVNGRFEFKVKHL